MLNKQTINGSSNNTAGRDVNVNNFYNFNYPIKHEMSIGNILKTYLNLLLTFNLKNQTLGNIQLKKKLTIIN
ncbi:hypothetical protein A0Y88_04625 [Campylobacter upsaliensis]|nr:hypothetical protein [Campylobacter upsaliensis]